MSRGDDDPETPARATRHEVMNPDGLSPAAGFSHVVRPAAGRLVFLAGQTAASTTGEAPRGSMTEQFGIAIRKVARAVEAAGGVPGDVVWLQLFTTDMDAYLDARSDIAPRFRDAFGRHFPAMSLFEVSRLVHPTATIEIVAIAVVPEGDGHP